MIGRIFLKRASFILLVAAASPGGAPFKITINPEARVSVEMAGPLPPPAACGAPVDLPVRIINEGFLMSRLDAQLVGDMPLGTVLEFQPEPLKGLPEEMRSLRITLAKPGTADLTVAFKPHNEIPDIGGRDRVHFLMRCN